MLESLSQVVFVRRSGPQPISNTVLSTIGSTQLTPKGKRWGGGGGIGHHSESTLYLKDEQSLRAFDILDCLNIGRPYKPIPVGFNNVFQYKKLLDFWFDGLYECCFVSFILSSVIFLFVRIFQANLESRYMYEPKYFTREQIPTLTSKFMKIYVSSPILMHVEN